MERSIHDTGFGAEGMRRRLRELEARNQALERRIVEAGSLLGAEGADAAGRARAWLAAIVESSDDAIVSKTLDGIVTSWNPAAERLFGYSAEEMIGAPILAIIPPELHREEARILECVAGGRPVRHHETTRVRKDGARIRVSISVSPVRDAQGTIVGAAKVARDLSAGHEAERAKAALAAIVEGSDDAILGLDLQGVVTSWNAGAEHLYGYTAAEMVGTPVFRLIPREFHGEEAGILSRVRAGERVRHFVSVRLRKDGRPVQVSLTVSPVRDASGEIVGASKVARDVTPQREAERTRAVLAAIVEYSDDAIVSKDLDGIVTSWNPAAERMYGYTAEEMIGQPIRRVIPPELQAEEDDILARIRRGERLSHFETVRVTRDGRRIEVSITVSPLRDAAGNVIGASKIARDITPQREAERRKDEFLAVLAHELRNPLAPIRSAVSVFAQPGVTEAQRARAQSIAERQVRHMARLLDDLLDVSRISAGRVELKKERVELGALVAQALDAMRGPMEERRHQLATDLAREPIWLEADPVRIVQIVINLLGNAAKYTDPGGRIRLATRREGGDAVVEVEDNGIGFGPELRPRLFTLFSQDKAALDRAAGGLGIGLALVREFVERHGGTVEADSPGRGRGSRFTVRLPAFL